MSVNPLNLEIENVKVIGGYFIYSLVTLTDGDILFTGNKDAEDDNLNQIFKLNKDSGEVTIYAGSGGKGNNDGLAAQASFNNPIHLAILSDGNVVVADKDNHLVRHISSPSSKMRLVVTIAGDKSGGGFLDGPALSAKFVHPRSLCVDKNDTIYIYDWYNDRIRCLKDGIVTTLGGDGSNGFLDGPALSVGLNGNIGQMAFDSKENIIFTTPGYSSLRKLDLESNIITTIAGKHNIEGETDGNSLNEARFCTPQGLVVDALDTFYVSDIYNRDGVEYCKIRKVSNDGKISTLLKDEVNFNFNCRHMSLDNFGNLLLPALTQSVNTIQKVNTQLNTNKAPSSVISTTTNRMMLLSNLFENPKSTKSDIKFDVEGTIIEAHQCILIAVSPVFMKLLSNDFKEGSEGKVNIKDTTPEAFQSLLSIIYTGNIIKYCNYGVVCDLYFLAKKYLFVDLENYCEFQIKKSSAEYLIQRFIWADAHSSLTDLRDYLKFQIVKKYKEIKETYPDHIKELCKYSNDLSHEIMMLLT